jgi:hypothetical protein
MIVNKTCLQVKIGDKEPIVLMCDPGTDLNVLIQVLDMMRNEVEKILIEHKKSQEAKESESLNGETIHSGCY